MMVMDADVVVIGAGITGAAIARELSKYALDIILVEKEADFCSGASKANTGIIHAGYHDPSGTLKAMLCVKGNAMCEKLAGELGVAFERNGALVVALNDEDLENLQKLRQRGIKNGVPGLRIIGKGELREMEPNLTQNAVGALYAPTAGIILPYEMTIALCENAVHNGVMPLLEAEVRGIEKQDGRVKRVLTPRGTIETRFVVNAAGLYADDISKMVGIGDFYIYPRKGEYFIFDEKIGSLVNRPVFPTPTPASKGILITKTIDGNTMIGPNAQDLDVRCKYEQDGDATTKEGLREVWEATSSLVPGLPGGMTIKNFAGLRAVSNTRDFIIRSYKEVKGFINVAGITSPGLTAAPAIGELVVEILRGEGLELKPRKEFDPFRKKPPRFASLSPEERESLIARDPRYGRIVCRCENVTEGEIVEAIRRGARTMDGIKYRTHCGMGRCQGAFDTPGCSRILARELNIPLERVTVKGKGTEIVRRRLKEDRDGERQRDED